MLRTLLAILLLTSVSLAQSSIPDLRPSSRGMKRFGVLQGTVVSPSGDPISGARIIIRPLSGGGSVSMMSSGADGSFSVPGLPTGEYEVTAQKGVQEDRVMVALDAPFQEVRLRIASDESTAGPAASGQGSVSFNSLNAPRKAQDEYRKGIEALKKREIEKARERLDRALQIYPTYADALSARAVIEMGSDAQRASQFASEAVRNDPDNAFAHTVLSACFNLVSQFDKARTEAEIALRRSANMWQAHLERAKALLGLRRAPEALQSADRAIDLSKGEFVAVHMVRSRILQALGRSDEAAQELRAFIANTRNPEDKQIAENALRSFPNVPK